jgi:hypothetical protein
MVSMRRPSPFLTGIVAAFLLAGAAYATPVPIPSTTVVNAPNWSVGSEWHYSDGYAMKVKSVSPKETVFDRLDAPGQWFSRQGFLRKDEISGTATRTSIYRTIPEGAGLALLAAQPLTFQREYMSNGKLMVHASSWTVEGRETITVPAGTFDCWLIVWRTRSLRSDWTGFERWWYSPEAQSYVRLEFKYGLEPEGSRVLMHYRLGRAERTVPADAKLLTSSSGQTAQPLPRPRDAAEQKQAPVKVAALPVGGPSAAAVAVNGDHGNFAAPAATPKQPQADANAAIDTDNSPALIAASPDRVNDSSSAVSLRAAKIHTRLLQANFGRTGSWHAQVGSLQDATAIRASLQSILRRNPRARALPSGILAHNIAGRGTFFRAWIGSYDEVGGAEKLCQSLKLGRSGCMPFKRDTMEAKAY